MDEPSPPVRRGPHAVLLAALALATGAVTCVGLYFLIGFVLAHWRSIALILATAAVLAAVLAVCIVKRRWDARQRAERLREMAHLERVDQMTGREFEELTAALLHRDGYRRVEIVGKAGDGGADVLAVAPDGRRIAVQCKRYSSTIGVRHVREMVGAVNATYRDHVGVFVTSNHFTKPAVNEAGSLLVLLDRDRLARWMDGTPLVCELPEAFSATG
ncbi:restriction endonuclease [Actinomadura xylanilytica]|uniref:restriction endonuclease n=1 Tax=Actinomadura xylanilytica TaxID=887459 RepID=UPI00255AD5AB|nr:restriction endonuclease [Actinomadura xylanilytica]MDL4773548.1 restriction endonuclease [Actinomadura xylanilytica]